VGATMQPPEEGCKLEELVAFVYRIYRSTEGAYPLLEWVEEKPAVDNRAAFEGVYLPFLEMRMQKEFDKLYVWRESDIIATVALVYDFKSKNIEWFPSSLMNDSTALIEFLMVAPEYQGKGYGKGALEYAIKKLRAMGKRAYVVTSKHLGAYDFYRKHGFSDVRRYREFIIMVHD